MITLSLPGDFAETLPHKVVKGSGERSTSTLPADYGIKHEQEFTNKKRQEMVSRSYQYHQCKMINRPHECRY
jgi:hypothetical protein